MGLGEKDQSFRFDAIALLEQESYENPRVKALLSRIAYEDIDSAARRIAALTLGEATE